MDEVKQKAAEILNIFAKARKQIANLRIKKRQTVERIKQELDSKEADKIRDKIRII